ncbi:MAG: hypothetical protein IH946_12095 [Bacteroidetes bacterium]|nr:hypothetical protein [Bacteroidota bacterium]
MLTLNPSRLTAQGLLGGTAGYNYNSDDHDTNGAGDLEISTSKDVSASTGKREPIEMADQLRSSGKIWFVVLVLLIILSGVFVYLISLDRRIGRIENKDD